MSKKEFTWKNGRNQALHCFSFTPETEPRAVLFWHPGLGDHAGRYADGEGPMRRQDPDQLQQRVRPQRLRSGASSLERWRCSSLRFWRSVASQGFQMG